MSAYHGQAVDSDSDRGLQKHCQPCKPPTPMLFA